MKEYPDPHQYFEKHLKQSADRYFEGLQQAGLEPNETLTRAITRRAIHQAELNYIQEVEQIRDQNMDQVRADHKRRMNQIKREGMSLRLKMCPPVAILFGLTAWYSFSQGDSAMGVLYCACSLAFLGMLILGAIFDRPKL